MQESVFFLNNHGSAHLICYVRDSFHPTIYHLKYNFAIKNDCIAIMRYLVILSFLLKWSAHDLHFTQGKKQYCKKIKLLFCTLFLQTDFLQKSKEKMCATNPIYGLRSRSRQPRTVRYLASRQENLMYHATYFPCAYRCVHTRYIPL